MGKNKKYLLLASVLSGFFIMGFCDIVGISSDYVQQQFGWSSFKTSLVPSLVFIWFLFLGVPVGNAMNKWGRKNTVLVGMAITLLGMILPLILFNSTTCLITYIFLGVGNAILQVSLNPLLINVVTNKQVLTSSLTAGQVIKAISSLVGPEIILFSVNYFGGAHWYYCFPILGAFTLISALSLIVSPIPMEEIQPTHSSNKEIWNLCKNKTFIFLFLGIFFVVGLDVSINFISSKIMTYRCGWLPEQAKFAPQAYFLCRTIGAFIGAFLLMKIKDIFYFIGSILLCLVTAIIWLMVTGDIANMVCIGAIGFFAAPIFSIIYTIAMKLFPEQANNVSGLLITAIAGGGIISPFIGIVTTFIGITGGIWIALLCTIYLVFTSLYIKNS